MPLTLLHMLFVVPRKIPHVKKLVFEQNYTDIATPMKQISLKDKLDFLCQSMIDKAIVFDVHGPASFGSMIKAMFLRLTMKGLEANTDDLDNDMNLMMSHCNDVISAEVPNMLREIAKAVQDKESFIKLTDEEALDVLRSKSSTESKASEIFDEFLTKHGHRCYRELDPMYPTWRTVPIPVVQVIKSLIKGGGSNLEAKKAIPVDEVLSQLKAPLTGFKRFLVKYWLLPWLHNAVGYRENTKSILVKLTESMRIAIDQIAQDLVEDGILPEADLFFYLKPCEIARLSGGERNPLLVMKAKQRKRLYPQMNAFKFDEFPKGFRMAPKVSVAHKTGYSKISIIWKKVKALLKEGGTSP